MPLPQLKKPVGVVDGEDVRTLFEYARANKFAIPAINVTSSSTAIAALEAARDLKAPIILQISTGGSHFFAGKGLKEKHKAMVAGALAAARFIRSIAPSYGIPVILHTDHCPQEELPWLSGMLEADTNNREYDDIDSNDPAFDKLKKLEETIKEAINQTVNENKAAIKQKEPISPEDQDKLDKKLDAKLKALKEEIQQIQENIQSAVKKPVKQSLFSSHMIDCSHLSDAKNIEETVKYLKLSKEAGTWLEMEIGITGGEEDGVNNENADRKKLYTNPKDIWAVYQALSEVSPNFSIAAAFGNVHGVYKPGAVKLRPWLLGKHQKYVKAKIENPTAGDLPGAIIPDEPDDMNPEDDGPDEAPEKKYPVFFVFHGGSGSGKEEFQKAISHGVVKVNIDTDTQFAYTKPVRDWMVDGAERLEVPVGTKKDPSGPPNKKLFDPRNWSREAEKGMKTRVEEALKDFNTAGKWDTSA